MIMPKFCLGSKQSCLFCRHKSYRLVIIRPSQFCFQQILWVQLNTILLLGWQLWPSLCNLLWSGKRTLLRRTWNLFLWKANQLLQNNLEPIVKRSIFIVTFNVFEFLIILYLLIHWKIVQLNLKNMPHE